MNSNTIKIIGTAEIPEALEMGFDYAIAGRLSVPSIEKQDNQDGSFTYQHKGKLQLIQIVNKSGKTFKGIAKGSKSQKLRWKIMERGDNDFYELVMNSIIENIDWYIETVFDPINQHKNA